MHDDARAVATALAGNRLGYRALFDHHRLAAERVVAGFPELDEAEAREVLLESFARAFGRLGTLKAPARFRAWLLAVTRQRCRSLLARKRDAEAIAADLSAPAVELAADPGPHALDVPGLVAGLPEGPEREAARLFYVEGRLTARQVAERVRLSPEATGYALERLRTAVKARLAGRLLAQRVDGAAGPGPEHLDAETWNHVLRGERLAREAQLAAHLQAGCPACERFLGGLQGADGLDGEVDRALVPASLEAGPPARGDTAFEQAMRRLHLHWRVAGGALPPGRSQPSNALAIGLAAALALAGLLVLALQRGARTDPHAGGREALVLRFTTAVAGQPRDSGEPGEPGGVYPDDRVVFLSYQLASPAFVTLLRVGPDDRAEVLSQPGRVGSGAHDLLVNGTPAGVSLRGFGGRNGFVAVASAAPVPVESLTALFSSFPETAPSAPALEQAHVARFDVEVVEEGSAP